jgi:Pyridine nucleotide-disulphide oxidoreductase
MPATEVLIIGAGPFGVSISAHLNGLGVDHQIVGRPMNTWRGHMPAGMFLKSEPYASEIASPSGGYDLAAWYRLRGFDYVNRVAPVPLDRFLGYADWYVEQLAPDVRDVTAADISVVDEGFLVAFADAEPVTARKVVVATGILPFAHIPAELSGLPDDLVTHSSEHDGLTQFRGRRVAVVGAGQSSLETAALLHEAGADTTIVARIPKVRFVGANPSHLSALGHVRRPVVKLCEGWHCAFWNSPTAFRRLPRDMRITKARTVLGPAGAAWLKDRVDGVVETLGGHRVRAATPQGSGVRLLLDGQTPSIDVDHVIAGTGFRVQLDRLPFLPDGLRTRITTENGYPVLSRSFESTVPGLYFVGAPAAVSNGPSARFIAGTHNTAARVARSLSGRRGSGRATPEAGSGDVQPASKDAAFQQTA